MIVRSRNRPGVDRAKWAFAVLFAEGWGRPTKDGPTSRKRTLWAIERCTEHAPICRSIPNELVADEDVIRSELEIQVFWDRYSVSAVVDFDIG